MQINTRLVEERGRLRLTQTEMAQKGGVAFRTYCDYESGKSEPRASFLAEVALAGVDVLYVLTGNRSAAQLAPDEEMVLAGYRLLDARGRAGVVGLIGGMQPEKKSKTEMVFKAGVGQVQKVKGDYIQNEPVTFNVGVKSKRSK